MTMMYLPLLMVVTENDPVLLEEIFPLKGNILINAMFDRTPTSSGMGFGAVISLVITTGLFFV